MKTAICDPDRSSRQAMAELLKLYAFEIAFSCDIDFYESGGNLLYEIEDGALFDIVFLAIQMDGMSGIEVARRLRRLKYTGSIIFSTTCPNFAVESYDVGAGGYLLKPLSYDKLCQTLNRILGAMITDTYPIRYRNGMVHIPYADILYVESSNSKCTLYCRDGSSYILYKHLSEIEKELCDPRFLRCHQSYLVNMDYVRAVDKGFELVTGQQILIRQRQLKTVRQSYLDYAARCDRQRQRVKTLKQKTACP